MISTVEQEMAVLRQVFVETGGVVTVDDFAEVVKQAGTVAYDVWHSTTSRLTVEQDTAVLKQVFTDTGGDVIVLLVLVELLEVAEVVWQLGSVTYEVSHSNSCLFPRRNMTSTVEQETAVLTHVLTETGGDVIVLLELVELIDVFKQAGFVT